MYSKNGLDLKLQEARYSEWIAWRGLIPVDTFKAAMGEDTSNKVQCVAVAQLVTGVQS